MATVRPIDAIYPIPDADAIECAVLGGWKVVVKKNEFTVGDLAIYCEIDSWIPNTLVPFLTKPGHTPKEYEGVLGERLRTVRLRKQLSQGLLLPYSVIGRIAVENEDVSEELNIQKWEAPVNAQLTGLIKGNFPSVLRKTDQERLQNLKLELQSYAGKEFEITEKLEGSSMTCYIIDGVFGVCSRNLDLKPDENNTFWKVAIEQEIEYRMRLEGMNNMAIQGELIGPGIQGNIYKLNFPKFYIFDVFSCHEGQYIEPEIRQKMVGKLGLNHVPTITVSLQLNPNMDELLEIAQGPSLLNPKQEREGIVFKACKFPFTFKAISNKYLLTH